MICVFCGNKIDDSTSICPYCSQKVTPVSEPVAEIVQPIEAQPSQEPAPQPTYYHLPQQQEIQYQGQYTAPTQPQGQGYYQQYNNPYAQQGYYQQQNPYGMDIARAIENTRTLGILSIVLGLAFSSIVGLVLGAIGMSKINSYYAMYPGMPEIKRAKSLVNWGIGLSAARLILIVISYIIAAFVFAAFGTAFS